ncbi:MAG: iron-sulfur cluster assembly scaffold protein [Candidatus Bipolaricaulia bacterium]
MATDFDGFEEGRQKRTTEDSRSAYSDGAVERFLNPKNLGRLAEADAYGVVHGWCGDTMEIYLRLTGERIKEAGFMTDGCGLTVACGSMLTTMIEGLSVEEAQKITPQQLIEAVNGLPEENAHCAKLAVDTLLVALKNRTSDRPAP